MSSAVRNGPKPMTIPNGQEAIKPIYLCCYSALPNFDKRTHRYYFKCNDCGSSGFVFGRYEVAHECWKRAALNKYNLQVIEEKRKREKMDGGAIYLFGGL